MNTISDNNLEIMSKDKKLHTAEEQHTAMDKIGGFVFQFYYFLYQSPLRNWTMRQWRVAKEFRLFKLSIR